MTLRTKLLIAGAVLILLGFGVHFIAPGAVDWLLGLAGASLFGWNLHGGEAKEQAEFEQREKAREQERASQAGQEYSRTLDASEAEKQGLAVEARASAEGAKIMEIQREISDIQTQGRRDVADAATAMERAARLRRLRTKLETYRSREEARRINGF